MDELTTFLDTHNISLSNKQKDQFLQFLQELMKWNSHTNLTAIRTEEEIIKKHFIDSLTLIPYIPASARKIIDIGSGAGFPGFPIKIMKPELYVTLLDSVKKKTDFHNYIISNLNLKEITTLNARVEDIAQLDEYREKFDVVTARAVANLSTLIEYAIPLLKIGGVCIAQKSINDEEIVLAQHALDELHASIIETITIDIPNLSPRQLLIIKKKSGTSSEYPRHNGIPLKNPL